MVKKNLISLKTIFQETRAYIHTTKCLNESPIKIKQVATQNFVDPKKENFVDRLYVWGYAGVGALGEPEFIEPTRNQARVYTQRKPWRLRWIDKNKADVTNVACGNGFSLFSISNSIHFKGHNLFGTGMNTQSQIGVHEGKNGDFFKYIIQPVHIQLPIDRQMNEKFRILDITCGRVHSLVLTNMGIFSFGNNSYGQCARPIIDGEEYFGNRGVIQDISRFLEMDSSDSVVSIKAGQDHSVFLTKNGRVLTCGWAADGQLGQEIYTLNPIPSSVRGDLLGVKVKKIATKGDYVLALSEEGEVFGWGNNEYKQLSMAGTNEPQIGVSLHLQIPSYIRRPIMDISAGGTHCMLLDADQNVWVWGYGLLGKGPKCEESTEPTQIPNTLFGAYKEIESTLNKRAISVHSGLYSSAVILNDGNLFMWGRNKYGNLGIGEKMDGVHMPIRVNIPARAKKIDCGPDQTFAICKTNI
ncbi:unnamed protein product [Brachionus calyciflorus]|uniref:RCC1-like domain-containing protein n=1 Tax=Brachionus calyciflorus TaxID=104777 RepID=A0A813MAC0_9BILA|nr:unnamed protein product [Brachionus calyciflorus]